MGLMTTVRAPRHCRVPRMPYVAAAPAAGRRLVRAETRRRPRVMRLVACGGAHSGRRAGSLLRCVRQAQFSDMIGAAAVVGKQASSFAAGETTARDEARSCESDRKGARFARTERERRGAPAR